MKSRLIRKDSDVGKDGRQKVKGATEDEMVGCHHQLNGHEFEQAPDGEGQGGLACCSKCALKEWETAERLNSHTGTAMDASPSWRIDSAQMGGSYNATSQRQVNE